VIDVNSIENFLFGEAIVFDEYAQLIDGFISWEVFLCQSLFQFGVKFLILA
jgi:hypothetical protein